MEDRIIKLKDLPNVVGLGRTAILEAIEAGTFPRPLRLTDSPVNGAKGWLMSEVQEWIRDRAAKRDGREAR